VRRIYGLKRKKIFTGWRKLHNEELHILYTSLDINRVLKSRWARCMRCVARMRGKRNKEVEEITKRGAS
jgi:hypothetical protein